MLSKNLRYLVVGAPCGYSRVVEECPGNVHVCTEQESWSCESDGRLFTIGDYHRADRASPDVEGDILLVFDCNDCSHLNQVLQVAKKYHDRVLDEELQLELDRSVY